MWGPCCPTITAKSILIKNTTEGTTHKKCKEMEGTERVGEKRGGEKREMRGRDDRERRIKDGACKMVEME